MRFFIAASPERLLEPLGADAPDVPVLLVCRRGDGRRLPCDRDSDDVGLYHCWLTILVEEIVIRARYLHRVLARAVELIDFFEIGLVGFCLPG